MFELLLFLFGLPALLAGLALGGVWLAAPIVARVVPLLRLSATWDRRLRSGALLCGLPGAAAVTFVVEPTIRPMRYLPTIERRAAPIIAAVDRYVAEHGAPPESEEQLVPTHLAAWPDESFRGHGFFYERNDRFGGDPREWCLRVHTGLGFDFEDDSAIVFVSRSRRWTYSPD